MVLPSRLAAGGLLLLLAVLALGLDGKPLRQAPAARPVRAVHPALRRQVRSEGPAGLRWWRPPRPGQGCFGLKLDRIGTRSGLGC